MTERNKMSRDNNNTEGQGPQHQHKLIDRLSSQSIKSCKGLNRRRRETIRKISRERQAALTEKSIQRMHDNAGSDSRRKTEGEKLMKFLWKDVKLRACDSLDLTLNHDVVELRHLDPKGTLLKYAVSRNYTDVVAILLRHHSPIESHGEDGLSPLHLAIKLGYIPIFAMLLSNNSFINIPTQFENRTPLHIAVRCNSTEAMELLLSHGADPNKGDIYGSAPLHLAARLGRDHLIRILLDNGASVFAIDNEGWTALHAASEAGHLGTVGLLLQRNSLVDAQSKYGKTCLHWACGNGHLQIVQSLLDYNANPAICDLSGKTPSAYASIPALRTLLSQHCDQKKKCKESGNCKKNPYMEFRLPNNKSLIDLLDLSQYKDAYAHNLNVETVGRGAMQDALSIIQQEKSKSMPYIMYDSDSALSSVEEGARPRVPSFGNTPLHTNSFTLGGEPIVDGSGTTHIEKVDKSKLYSKCHSIQSLSSPQLLSVIAQDWECKIDSSPVCESIPLLSLGTILEAPTPEASPRFSPKPSPKAIPKLSYNSRGSSLTSSEPSPLPRRAAALREHRAPSLCSGEGGSGTESSAEAGHDVIDSHLSPIIIADDVMLLGSPIPSPKQDYVCKIKLGDTCDTNSPFLPTKFEQKRTKKTSRTESDTEAVIEHVANSFRCKVSPRQLIETLENLHEKVDDSVDQNVDILNDVFGDVIMLRQQASALEPADRQVALENIERNLKNVVIKLKELRGNFNDISSEA